MSLNIPTRSAWPAWRPAAEAGDAAAAERQRRARLRRQGALRAAVGLALALVLAFWKPLLAAVVGGVGLVFLVLALAAPDGYARVAGWLERFGHAVGLAVTWLLMPALFYLLFLPVGLLLRSTGKLRITRGGDPSRASYWEEPVAGQAWGGGSDRYRRQF
jgi:hypothetical protein